MGSGAAFLDVDDDGWQDVFLVNSSQFAGRQGAESHPALYRNNGNGTFTDITRAAGLLIELYGMGAAAADSKRWPDRSVRDGVAQTGCSGILVPCDSSTADHASVGDPASPRAPHGWNNRDGALESVRGELCRMVAREDLFCTLTGS